MNESRRRRGSLTATLALLALVITTGWTQAAATAPHPAIPAAGFLASISAADAARSADEAALGQLLRRTTGAVVAGSVDSAFQVREQARRLAGSAVGAGSAVTPASVTTPAYGERRSPGPVSSAFSGRNRFWIPSLGISYRVHLYECSRTRGPDDYMYRWGCAGTNNVYILGHASSVMRPLHDLFVRGGLQVGMLALYADGNGIVRAFRVTEWRVVDPVDSHWAIASQPTPSMTLQTCVGKNGVDRLNVRLVEVR